MFDIKAILLAIAASATISGSIAVYYTAKYKDGVYAQKIQEIERVANETLQKEKDRASKTEHDLIATRDRLEIENAKNKKRINELLGKYNAVIDAGGRLRDPGARQGCQNASSTNPAAADTASGAGAELSPEASRFLLSEAARADEVVEQLNLCKAWVTEVSAILEKHNQDNP